MKKRLSIISFVIAVVMCLSLLTACAGGGASLTGDQLSLLLDDLKDQYRNGISGSDITNNSYTLPYTARIMDSEGNEIVAYIDWVSSSAQVVVGERNTETGKVTVTVPSNVTADISYTLTATLVDENGNAYKDADGNAYTHNINLKVTKTAIVASIKKALDAVTVATPVAGTSYKLAYFHTPTQELRYLKGTGTDDYKFATTDKYSEAVDVQIEDAADGTGFYLFFMDGETKTYIELKTYNNNGSVTYKTTTPSVVMTMNETYKTPVSAVGTATVWFGAYNNYNDTMRGRLEKYLSQETDNSPCHFVTSDVQDIVLPQATTLTQDQILAEIATLAPNDSIWGAQTLTGVVKEVSGTDYGLECTITVGGVEIAVKGADAGSGVTLASIKAGDTITVTGVICNYSYSGSAQYCTPSFIKCSEVTSHVAGEGGSTETPTAPAAVDAPVVGTAYKLVMNSSSKGVLYAQNYMASGSASYYGATVTDVATASDWYVETATDGFYIYSLGTDNAKIYINAVVSDDGEHINFKLQGTGTSVWALEEGKWVTTLEGTKYFLGTSGTYNTNAINPMDKQNPVPAYFALAE